MKGITTWRVIYYVSPSGAIPVKAFLDAANPKLKTKALRILMHIEEYGLQAIIPHVKKLSGTPLWEIRIVGRDNVRILFSTRVERRVVLLHAFYKKTQQTPRKEIIIAMDRFNEYVSQQKGS